MSKARAAHKRATEAAANRSAAAPRPRSTPIAAPVSVMPMKPRPALFWILAVVLIVLAAGMLALYFKTVYPYRYAPHAVEDDRTPPSAAVAR